MVDRKKSTTQNPSPAICGNFDARRSPASARTHLPASSDIREREQRTLKMRLHLAKIDNSLIQREECIMRIIPRFIVSSLVGVAWPFIVATTLAADTPKIVSVQKIWDQGRHNAFTDLIRWHDMWYCVFREADAHVGGDGKIRVLESINGKAWKSAALIGEKGIDLRDPKLSVTPDDCLMIAAGGSVYAGGNKILGRQPRVIFSRDARVWTVPQRVLSEGDWLWRVTWHADRAYGMSYPGKPKLFAGNDGIHYDLVTELKGPGTLDETTLRFLPNGEMIALVRNENGNKNGLIGISQAPYRVWKWHETHYRLGGPNFIVLPDGAMWAAGRGHLPEGTKTIVARFGPETYEPVLTLPSGGDTGYPGLVWHDNLLWMSYYSSHEGKTSIYLATIKLR